VLPKILKPYHIKKSNLIRLGPKKDGGYVIDKRVINKTETVITCGLNDDWNFESKFLEHNDKCKVFAYDHTVDRNFWIKRFKKDLISLLLLKKLRLNKIIDIFKYINYRIFFKDKNTHYIKKIVSKKKNVNQITINEILKNLKNVLLKIDIEGDEYKVLKDINKNTKKINLLIIEFHNVFKNFDKIKNFIINSDLKIIHIHANNYSGLCKRNLPKVLEITFLNRKKFKLDNQKSRYNYPITNLDYSNLTRKKDIKITFNE